MLVEAFTYYIYLFMYVCLYFNVYIYIYTYINIYVCVSGVFVVLDRTRSVCGVADRLHA